MTGSNLRSRGTMASTARPEPRDTSLRRAETTMATPALRLRRGPSPSFWVRLAATGTVLLLLAILGLFFSSDDFYVAHANVTGINLLSADEVYTASGVAGYSIFYVDPRGVAAGLRRLPYIKDAQVRIHLPNQVDIAVVERQPVAIWVQGASETWVDSDGVVLQPRGSSDKLIRISDPAGAGRRPDNSIDPALVQGALSLHDLIPALTSFNYTQTYGLNYVAPEGWQVYMGDGNNMADKVRVLSALRNQIVQQNAHPKLIDLRFKDQSYYK